VAVAGAVAFTLLGCHHKEERTFPAGLMAVVQHHDALLVQRQVGNEWRTEKQLPPEARALRFSLDGTTVAWVQDEKEGPNPVQRGYVMGAQDEKPRLLGTLGLRQQQAMGLAVRPDGHVVWLNPTGELVDSATQQPVGRGSDVIFGDSGELAFIDGSGCLQAPAIGSTGSLCGGALRPVDYLRGVLLARDNRGVLELGLGQPHRIAMSDVLDAHLRHHGEVVVTRRVNEGKSVAEAVYVLRPDDIVREVTRSAVIVSARFDSDGGILVVRSSIRKSLYDNLLAHAPDEFGGEALAGDALRFTPTRLTESAVPGLELVPVRALFRAEASQPAEATK
jgi:hypothetical protein